MDEKDLELIKVIAETRSLTSAADELYLTQSAISKRIKSMEDELNTQIFIRSHHGVRLTTAGELVLEKAIKITQELSEMKNYLESHGKDVYGSLTVGVSDNYMYYHLPDVAASYHRKYPNVKITFKTNKGHLLYPLVMDNAVDIAIIRGNFWWDGVKQLLSTEAMCVVYDRSLEGIPLGDLTYIDRTTDTVQYALMNKWRHENNLMSCPSQIVMDSISSAMDLVKRGIGWALIPEIALENYDGVIKPCYFANGELFVRQTYLLCKDEVANMPQTKTFIDEVLSRKIIYPYGKEYRGETKGGYNF